MKDQTQAAMVDPELTPQNAKERGYAYIDDVFFNSNFPHQEIQVLMQDHGHRLGKASKQAEWESYYGLYAPITKKEEKAIL